MGKQILNVLISIYPETFILHEDKVGLATLNMEFAWSKEIDLQTVESYLRIELFFTHLNLKKLFNDYKQICSSELL